LIGANAIMLTACGLALVDIVAVETIVIQQVPVFTGAAIGSGCVEATVFAPTVTIQTFVQVLLA
jgi:hypothetical protein